MGVTNYLLSGMILQVWVKQPVFHGSRYPAVFIFSTVAFEVTKHLSGAVGSWKLCGLFSWQGGEVRWPQITKEETESQVTHEKILGWLGYIGDDELPSFMGITMNHYKDPY